MKITNLTPFVLSPVYNDNINGAFDPKESIRQIFATPMFTPTIQTHPVTITGANNQNITEDDIINLIIKTSGDTIDAIAEKTAKELFGDTLVTFNKNTNLNASDVFTIQSMTKAGLPEPNANVIYTPAADVIPTSKNFMNGKCDYDEWFASLSLYARPETLGFYFVNEPAFEDFKTWLSAQMALLGNAMPPETNRLMADFQTLSLKDLTESVLLRAKDDENNDPQSFARLIVLLLMNYTKVVSPGEFGVLPFDVPELLCPRSIVFVNVERHARATPKQIADEWKLINNSVKTIPTMVSNQKLKKLTSAQRTLQKISSAAANAATNAMQTATKSARVKFSSKEPTTMDITRHVRKIMEKMAFVAKSMNTYKKVKATYAKPNRRDPDDFNKQGKSISTRYKPDIHLYIDTSGSISERNYEDIVKACILMAKKLNINLYFNSFSHIMSQTTKLNTKDKTREQIYNEFQRVPKVSGGTDYEQIWHFINSSKKRIQEISLLITDFEYDPPRKYVKHPKNLYYVPCSHQNWNNITYYANMFCQSMMSKDPGIRRHILF